MPLFKRQFSFILFVTFLAWLMLGACNTNAEFMEKTDSAITQENTMAIYNSKDSCKKQIKKLLTFAKQNNSNTELFFIIDLEQHSGKARFFIFDNNEDSVVASGLVAQGQGKELSAKPTYSNVSGSYCSSKGIYSIGNAYNGRFGLAYKLYGKEPSNNNAFSRFVVLHAHSCVPDEEVFPSHICQSQGCPTVSENFLKVLANYIDKSDKPILLQII